MQSQLNNNCNGLCPVLSRSLPWITATTTAAAASDLPRALSKQPSLSFPVSRQSNSALLLLPLLFLHNPPARLNYQSGKGRGIHLNGLLHTDRQTGTGEGPTTGPTYLPTVSLSPSPSLLIFSVLRAEEGSPAFYNSLPPGAAGRVGGLGGPARQRNASQSVLAPTECEEFQLILPGERARARPYPSAAMRRVWKMTSVCGDDDGDGRRTMNCREEREVKGGRECK